MVAEFLMPWKPVEYPLPDWEPSLTEARRIAFCPLMLGNGLPNVEKVIFHAPATIVYWADGTKTVVKCDERDAYSREAGLALCYMKKALGNKGNFNDVLKKWTGGDET